VNAADLMNLLALGCKRILFDTDYLSALHQDNVEVNWDGIDSIVKNGILTRQGEFQVRILYIYPWYLIAIGDLLNFDVIIVATGYATVHHFKLWSREYLKICLNRTDTRWFCKA
jgi:cation diffusion facilitator CzcD-associated flavoprotein CzcO